jgi:hypothetical protein
MKVFIVLLSDCGLEWEPGCLDRKMGEEEREQDLI